MEPHDAAPPALPAGTGEPHRQRLAAGEYVTAYPPGQPFQLRIESTHGMPGWKTRIAGTITRPTFPGSAVLFDGRCYEVVQQGDASHPGFVYYLVDWDERFPTRQLFTYSAAECERLAERRRNVAAQNRATLAMQLARPFVGLLPAEDQLRIETTHGLTAVRGTIVSAAVFFLLGGFATVQGVLAFLFGATPGAPLLFLRLCPLSLFLAGESAWRLLIALHVEMPIGSLLVAGPLHVVRAVRRAATPQAGAPPARVEPSERERKQSWVDAFAPLLGLLDVAAQSRLEALYGYDAPRNTGVSALGVAGLSGLAVFIALDYLLSRRGNVLDLAVLVVGALLLLESVRRLRIAKAGGVAGSVLGWLIRPFVASLVA